MVGMNLIEFAYMLDVLSTYRSEAAFADDGGEIFVIKVSNGMLAGAKTLTGSEADAYRAVNSSNIIARPTKAVVTAWENTRAANKF